MKMNFFYIKEFEVGYVFTLSSVKILTYKYCKSNKTLSFIYHRLYAHRFVFCNVLYRHKKSFLFIEITLLYSKKHLRKIILL